MIVVRLILYGERIQTWSIIDLGINDISNSNLFVWFEDFLLTYHFAYMCGICNAF